MAAEARAASPALKPGGLDPLRWLWGLFTNVKFALLLVGFAAGAGLLGVVFPQMPGPMRQNAAAKQAWLELQRRDFGAFTTPLERLGLFDVFHTAWFNGLWVVIIAAVTVCTVSRFRPTWRGVHRPAKQVADAYFERAHHRADFSHPGGAEAVERLLRERRYHVERAKAGGDGTVYLFADRFAWSHYGTFLSHLALLMLLVGALLTQLAGFDRTFVLAETTPAAPVFDTPGPGQIFVRLLDAVRGRDERGNVIDFHSKLEVRRGDQLVTCTATVNNPCRAFGYKIHQAAFFDDVARLRVVAPSGQVVYDDVLDFNSESTAVPVMKVTADGRVLFNQEVPQMATDAGAKPGPEDDVAIAAVTFAKTPGSTDLVSYPIAWRVSNGQMLLTISGANGSFSPRALKQGEPLTDGAYRISFEGPQEIPAIKVADLPGAVTDDGSAIVQMPVGGDGRSYLYVTGADASNLILTDSGAVKAASGYSYSFLGRLEASGVSVKRDPGSTFIWVAVAMAMVGLAITFYVPRRRLWVKVTPERTYLAGVAERTTRFSRELRQLGARLGSPDALLPGDVEEG